MENLIFALAQKSKGEIPVPQPLVDEQLNSILEKNPTFFSNPNIRIYNPCCGSGTYIVSVYKRLMNGLVNVFPDESERKRHILQNMLYAVDIKFTFIAHTINLLDPTREYINAKNFACADSLIHNRNQKFDLIMCSAPFSDGSSNGNTVWSQHYDCYEEMLNTDGYFITNLPSRWRSPVTPLGDKSGRNSFYKRLSKKQVLLLRMIDSANDFNHARSDMLVIRNKNEEYDTHIYDTKNVQCRLLLSKYPWIPNFNLEHIFSLFTDDDNNRIGCKLTYECERRTKHMNRCTVPDENHKYACVNSITKDGSLDFYYSTRNDLPVMNSSKVILSHSGNCYAYNDYNKKYGVTQHMYYIKVDTNEEAEHICKFAKSEYFSELSQACKWSMQQAGIVDALRFFDKKIYASY